MSMKGCLQNITLDQRRELLNLAKAKMGLIKNKIPIIDPLEIVEKAVKEHKKHLSIGWSGGKCSTVVLKMALQFDSNIKVVYQNTGVEYPENIKYVRKLAEIWDLNLYELRPKTTFWKIVEKTGEMPAFRYGGKQKNRPRIPLCCNLLKHKPRNIFNKQNSITGNLAGLRAAESENRWKFLSCRGQQYHIKNPIPIMTYQPIAFWTSEQVNNFLKENNCPHNPVYNTQNRNGCWCCTAYVDYEKSIRAWNENAYNWFQKYKAKLMREQLIKNFSKAFEVRV